MKLFLMFLVTLALSTAAFANNNDETCFSLSTNGIAWSKTPEILCYSKYLPNADTVDNNLYTLTLKAGLPGMMQEYAQFNFNLISRVRSLTENQDVFAIENPENSAFNALAIQFDGKRNFLKRTEKGTVSIGSTKFYYRRSW